MSEPLGEHSGQASGGGSPRILLFSVVLIVAAALTAYLWYISGEKQNPAATTHLPFGAAEQSYASAIRAEGLTLERTENYLHQEVTTVKGSLLNSGNRPVQRVELNVEFQDDMNQVVLRHSFISAGPLPLAPSGSRDLEISLEHIPDSWNRQAPAVRVAGLEFARSR